MDRHPPSRPPNQASRVPTGEKTEIAVFSFREAEGATTYRDFVVLVRAIGHSSDRSGVHDDARGPYFVGTTTRNSRGYEDIRDALAEYGPQGDRNEPAEIVYDVSEPDRGGRGAGNQTCTKTVLSGFNSALHAALRKAFQIFGRNKK